MRLIRFNLHAEWPNAARLGAILAQNTVVDLPRAAERMMHEAGDPHSGALAALRFPGSLTAFLAGGAPARVALTEVTEWATALFDRDPRAPGLRGERLFADFAECRLHAPVRPPRVMVVRLGKEPGEDTILCRPIGCIVGPTRNIVPPSPDTRLVGSGGVALVVGKPMRRVAPAAVWDSLAGWSLMLDMKVAGSSGDFTGAMHETFAPGGPWLSLGSDRAGFEALSVVTRINDAQSDFFEAAMVSDRVAARVSELSYMALEPGDIVWIGNDRRDRPTLSLGDRIAAHGGALGDMEMHLATGQPPG